MSKSPAAPPGSIADVLARLELWCSRSDHGFIRITFDDGAARNLVVNHLEKAMQGKMSFHRLDLPRVANADLLADRLANELARLGPGIVSLTGFETSLPPTADAVEAALRSLNAARETFVHPQQHTLWWFPRHISEALIRGHHDLNSWFLKRAELTELITTPEERKINERWRHATQFKEVAKYQQAIAIAEELLSEEEKRLGPDHPRVALALNNLAQLFQDTNRLAEAEVMMRRALKIHESSHGPNNPDVALALNNLASLLQDTNRLAEAENPMRRALKIDEDNYGADHPIVATRLNNLASLLKATNRLAEAEEPMRRALKIDEAAYGPDHPIVARDLNNLAQLLHDTNRLEEAEEQIRRALQIYENSYGPDHPNVALALNNLAVLLLDTKRPTEAEWPIRRALKIDEGSYGPDHPNIARDLNNLAMLLRAKNLLAEAEEAMRRHLIIYAKFTAQTGHAHPRLRAAVDNYFGLLRESGHSEADASKKLLAALVEGGMSMEHIHSFLGI